MTYQLSGALLAGFLMLAGMPHLQAQNQSSSDRLPMLDEERAEWVAERIFQNECAQQVSCLTSWNAGEDFPSLGIGHFIWYRQAQQEPFVESFPGLLAFYVAQGVDLPGWLAGLPEWDSPWPDRAAFMADYDGERLQGLREFLYQTRAVQAQYIIRRMAQSLPGLMAASDRPQQIENLFYQIAGADLPYGMYALIDYVNFKGEGTSIDERYQGEGWGLLQVLEFMLDHPPRVPSQPELLERFAAAARAVLARRIDNAPPERGEERWRDGWNNRTYTYIPD
ncbi:hypothetical protein PS2015_998 [Pseudohongiella spirulinae]|uniref:Uncharacterized protein n=2 Tax=Pseudohongiella spirulinae TaxID=1249552 RepID=A0A0S2KC09_9GAMM|nr:hypothetical protein PS2015_998 [Pseudohongiella spirulinae]